MSFYLKTPNYETPSPRKVNEGQTKNSFSELKRGMVDSVSKQLETKKLSKQASNTSNEKSKRSKTWVDL